MTDLPRSPQRDTAKLACMICGSLPRELVATEAGWRCFDVYACARAAGRCPHCEQPTSPGSMHTCNPMFASEAIARVDASVDATMTQVVEELNAASLSSGTPAGSEVVERISAAIEWARREGESTSMMVREHGITTLDLRQVLASLRSAQERVTELTNVLADAQACNKALVEEVSRLDTALAVSQAREREAAKDDERFGVIARDALSLHCNFIGGDENWTVTYHDVVNAGEDSHFHAHSPRAAVDRYLESATAMYKKVRPGARSVDGGTPA